MADSRARDVTASPPALKPPHRRFHVKSLSPESAALPSCKEFAKQNYIQRYAVFNNLSYMEARSVLHPKKKRFIIRILMFLIFLLFQRKVLLQIPWDLTSSHHCWLYLRRILVCLFPPVLWEIIFLHHMRRSLLVGTSLTNQVVLKLRHIIWRNKLKLTIRHANTWYNLTVDSPLQALQTDLPRNVFSWQAVHFYSFLIVWLAG